MEFYNVRKKAKVTIDDAKCEKVEYPRETSKGTQIRYGVKAVDDDGTHLTLFVSKEKFDALKCAVPGKAPKAAKKASKKK